MCCSCCAVCKPRLDQEKQVCSCAHSGRGVLGCYVGLGLSWSWGLEDLELCNESRACVFVCIRSIRSDVSVHVEPRSTGAPLSMAWNLHVQKLQCTCGPCGYRYGIIFMTIFSFCGTSKDQTHARRHRAASHVINHEHTPESFPNLFLAVALRQNCSRRARSLFHRFPSCPAL